MRNRTRVARLCGRRTHDQTECECQYHRLNWPHAVQRWGVENGSLPSHQPEDAARARLDRHRRQHELWVTHSGTLPVSMRSGSTIGDGYERVADQVRYAPNEADDLAVVHLSLSKSSFYANGINHTSLAQSPGSNPTSKIASGDRFVRQSGGSFGRPAIDGTAAPDPFPVRFCGFEDPRQGPLSYAASTVVATGQIERPLHPRSPVIGANDCWCVSY